LKAIDGLYFTEKSVAETLRSDLAFDNVKHGLNAVSSNGLLWMNGSCLFFIFIFLVARGRGYEQFLNEKRSQDQYYGTNFASLNLFASWLSAITSTYYDTSSHQDISRGRKWLEQRFKKFYYLFRKNVISRISPSQFTK
jgi:hypothetical protein